MPESAVDLRPRLLFISPAHPDTQGNGLAMRAGMFIEALAQRYRISLLVVPSFAWDTPTSRALVARYCDDVTVVPLRPPGRIGALLDRRPGVLRIYALQADACVAALGGRHFDVVHAFRMTTAPIALRVAAAAPPEHRPALHLDIDDIESITRARLSTLYASNGRKRESAIEAQESRRYAKAEHDLLHRFDRIYACSRQDAEYVQSLSPAEVLVIPNAVRPPEAPVMPRTSHAFTYLFVGTLGYFPNEDAVLWFSNEVLPLLRGLAGAPFRVRIAGTGAPPSLTALTALPEVRLAGEVPDVAPEYAEADAVIVPIRGGGGTRIKILEAFAYQRPVVATTAGAEGIEAEPERHLLIGDTPEDFARRCVRLMQDAELRRELAEQARRLVASQYSQTRVNELMLELP